ncbi:hypothetical protein, partial [Streptomyces sp. NPDC058086]|uniref:hypothetical protein n=1 Tax=Streptomyces sp. NPDC058086 TaxID=3346334 RepID=UPI0036F0103C
MSTPPQPETPDYHRSLAEQLIAMDSSPSPTGEQLMAAAEIIELGEADRLQVIKAVEEELQNNESSYFTREMPNVASLLHNDRETWPKNLGFIQPELQGQPRITQGSPSVASAAAAGASGGAVRTVAPSQN